MLHLSQAQMDRRADTFGEYAAPLVNASEGMAFDPMGHAWDRYAAIMGEYRRGETDLRTAKDRLRETIEQADAAADAGKGEN